MSKQPEEPNGKALIRYLLSQIRCPVCDHHYSPDDILVMGHQDELWILAILCPECETSGLILAIVEGQQEPSEPFTDLTPEEIGRFKGRGPITADDVLDFHELLRDYRGDLADLVDW
jgi:hypothetical protein